MNAADTTNPGRPDGTEPALPWRVLRPAAPNVGKVLGPGKAPADGAPLAVSRFALALDIDGGTVLANTFTLECLALEPGPTADLFREPEAAALRWPPEDPALRELHARRFLVAADADEAGLYVQVKGILRRLKRPARGYESFVILTTTVCNARCPYCYEGDWKQTPMSPETAEAAAAFILRGRAPGKAPVRLQWFGGEPLCGRAGIDRICAILEENGVAFRSSMISNASLFTPELADHAVKVWRLGRIQVTLDGPEATYNRVKNYRPAADLGPSPFRRVLENIRLLLDRKVAVSIRLNADDDNLDELDRLLDELRVVFFQDNQDSKGKTGGKAGTRRPHIYLHPIFKPPGPPEREAAFWARYEALEERLLEFATAADPWRGRRKRGENLRIKSTTAWPTIRAPAWSSIRPAT